MKYIFRCVSRNKKISLENRAYRALIIHTVLWFIVGSVIAWIIGLVCRAPGELLSSYIVTAGACSSLVIGYGAGVVWLLRYTE